MGLPLFWRDLLLDCAPFIVRLSRLYELAENKMAIVAVMNFIGWRVNAKVWNWRRRLFVLEDELVEECVELLTSVVLEVDLDDRWV